MGLWNRTLKSLAGGLALALLASCDEPAGPAQVQAPTFTTLPGENNFALAVPHDTDKNSFPDLARSHCGTRSPCAVYAWVAPDQPAQTLPLSERQLMTQAYSYVANRATKFELSLWNCQMYIRDNPAECMPDLQE